MKKKRFLNFLVNILLSIVSGVSAVTIIMILFGFLSNNLFKFYAFLKMCGINQYIARPIAISFMILLSLVFFVYFNKKSNMIKEKMAINEVIDICNKINKEE